MSRFHQRRREKLRDPEFLDAYQKARVEIALQHALDEIRQRRQITKEQLADRMGRRREAISRLLTAETSNPTLGTITSLLMALDVTAEIVLRQAAQDEAPMTVAVFDDIAPFTISSQYIDLSTEEMAPATDVAVNFVVDDHSGGSTHNLSGSGAYLMAA